jgi:hypothetical protein
MCRCSGLEDNHFAVFTHYKSLANQPDIEIFIKDIVALEAMLDCCSEGINLLLIATIGKHIV